MNKKLLMVITTGVLVWSFWNPEESVNANLPSHRHRKKIPVKTSVNRRSEGQPFAVGPSKIFNKPLSEGPSRAVASVDPSREINSIYSKLQNFRDCLDYQNCDIEDTDSRSYDINAGRDLSQHIKHLAAEVESTNTKNPEFAQLGLDLLTISDGAVKEQALRLILSQDPQKETVDSIIKDVLRFHDSNLVPAALVELQRHLLDTEVEKIHWNLRECLLTGSLLVRDAVSQNLGPFITSSSYDFYLHLSLELPPNSAVARNLKSVLDEWVLQKRGG